MGRLGNYPHAGQIQAPFLVAIVRQNIQRQASALVKVRAVVVSFRCLVPNGKAEGSIAHDACPAIAGCIFQTVRGECYVILVRWHQDLVQGNSDLSIVYRYLCVRNDKACVLDAVGGILDHQFTNTCKHGLVKRQ